MKKFTALVLIFFLLILTGELTAKEKQGARITVNTFDGQSILGELIAVKQETLLILELPSNRDVSIDVSDIKDIRIIKKSKALIGVLIGVPLGAMIGYVTYKEPVGRLHLMSGPGISAFGGGMLGGIAGLLTGVLLGTDEAFQFKGKSEGEVRGILQDLRSKARVPDYK